MDFWVVSNVVLWVVVLLNLLLTVGVIRRINAMGTAPAQALPPGLPPGEELPETIVTGLDGDELRLADVAAGPSVLLLISASCEGCRDQLPELRQVVRAAEGVHAVAIVATGDAAEAAAYRDEIPGATVVTAGARSDALSKLQVHSFPMYYAVDGQSRIAGSAFVPAQLAQLIDTIDTTPAR